MSQELKAAVVIVIKDNQVLMGLSASRDFRYKKYVFVGGKLDEGENAYEAAEREAWEESGLTVKTRRGEAYIIEERPSIVYVISDYVSGELTPNEEFFTLEWFDPSNLPTDTLPLNAQIIQKIFDLEEFI